LNIILTGFAAATILNNSLIFQIAMIAVGCVLVSSLLWTFNRTDVKQ